ncbi:hypothetical protein HAX54_035547 [Datura stramonium]|uniref:Uncharacterized protein n=1 Tax=Datura stramonium TaxID=4076 RepID=A0ABS8VJB3_DATST|nr:hypothetical protein [Datura stramonium]
MWSLQLSLHRYTNKVSAIPSLARQIVREEICWGEIVVFKGEYCHIPGYWEWAEDTIARSQESLIAAGIYDAVYALHFTYDRNSDVLQVFCEAWCPKSNTVLTSIGELSIYLRDLYILGGLPSGGSLYEKVIPEDTELTGTDAKDQSTLLEFLGQFLLRFWRLHIKNVAMQSQTGNSFTPLVMSSEQCKVKGPQSLKKTPIEKVSDQDCKGGKGYFPLSIATHVSKNRSSQGESNSSHEDRCWKKVRPHSDKLGDADLAVVEIHDSVDSPSRTLTILSKESNGSGELPREVSVFDEKKVVLSYRKMFISELWTVIWGKLSGSDVDHASSLKEEAQVILDEMNGKGLDVSPLMKLLKSFFELAAIYDQERSALHDKDMEDGRKKFFIIAGEHLSNSMLEEYEKIEKVFSIRQSQSEV